MKRFAFFLILLLLPFSALALSNDSFAYVVPSDQTMEVGGALRIDFMMNKSGRAIFTVFSSTGEQAARFGVNKDKNVIAKYIWKGTSDGDALPAGSYVLTARYERDDETQTLSFPLTITEKRAEVSLFDPLLFLPASLSDEDVWAAMMSPVFVADVKERDHQNIYVKPNAKSEVAGKVHGQTQALQIIGEEKDGFVYVGFFRHEDGEYTTGYVKRSALLAVRPNTEYGLLLDKQAQMMTVYFKGRPLTSLPVTTGLIVEGDMERETRAGAFLISDRLKAFTSHGYVYEYPLGFDGGNLIHQVGYPKGDKGNFSLQLSLLGRKDSHGCVRVSSEKNQEQINAQWLYQNLPYHTKVLVLDDEEERHQRMAALSAPTAAPIVTEGPPAAEAPIATEEPSHAEASSAAEATIAERTQVPVYQAVMNESEYLSSFSELTTLVVTAGGDCVLGSEDKSRKSELSFDSIVLDKGYAWPFSGLYELFSTDDVSFVNLESVFKNNSKDKTPYRQHNFRGRTDFVNVLTLGGIEVVNIANNHYIDYGAEGKRITRSTLTEAGVAYSGYGFTHIEEINGIKIGFGGIRETIYKQRPAKVDEDIKELRDQGADVIIYTCHFGKEYDRLHNELQETIAHRAVDAGADIVIGHHPHVVQGIEVYKDRPIFYSVGNLVFGGNLNLTEFDALVLRLKLDFTGNVYRGVRVSLLPVLTTGTMPANDFRPVLAQGEDQTRTLQKIQADSAIKISLDTLCFPIGE